MESLLSLFHEPLLWKQMVPPTSHQQRHPTTGAEWIQGLRSVPLAQLAMPAWYSCASNLGSEANRLLTPSPLLCCDPSGQSLTGWLKCFHQAQGGPRTQSLDKQREPNIILYYFESQLWTGNKLHYTLVYPSWNEHLLVDCCWHLIVDCWLLIVIVDKKKNDNCRKISEQSVPSKHSTNGSVHCCCSFLWWETRTLRCLVLISRGQGKRLKGSMEGLLYFQLIYKYFIYVMWYN